VRHVRSVERMWSGKFVIFVKSVLSDEFEEFFVYLFWTKFWTYYRVQSFFDPFINGSKIKLVVTFRPRRLEHL